MECYLMPISIVGDSFTGYDRSNPMAVTTPSGAAANDVLILVVGRKAALTSSMSGWTLQHTQQAIDSAGPIDLFVDIYTKAYQGESSISVAFSTVSNINSLALILARTTSGQLEKIWAESFGEFSGGSGTIEDNGHRFPYRPEAALFDQIVIKTSVCNFATFGLTAFDSAVGGVNNNWASRSNSTQATPGNVSDNRLFVAAELLSAGDTMLDGSGIGSSSPENAHSKHVTGIHEGGSITLVLVDPADGGQHFIDCGPDADINTRIGVILDSAGRITFRGIDGDVVRSDKGDDPSIADLRGRGDAVKVAAGEWRASGDIVPTLAFTSVAPDTGIAAGGTEVVMTGTGFVSGMPVTVGDVAVVGLVIDSPTQATFYTPAGTAGDVDIVVTAGNQVKTLFNGFTYT